MTLGVENMERIGFAFRKSKRIQIHLAGYSVVLPTDIDYKLVIDEHPHIVIAQKFKLLSLHVFELRLDLHGKAVVVASHDRIAQYVVIHRIRHSLCAIQKQEIIQEEKSLFRAFRIFLPKPKAVFCQREVEFTTGRVSIGIAGCILRNHFGKKPIVKMIGNLAIRREIRGPHRNPVGPQLRFDHALDAVIVAVTSARAKIGTNSIYGITIFSFTITIAALGAMQPVEHHDREFFDGAVAEFAREFRGKLGFAVHSGKHPYGIGNRKNRIEQDFVFDRNFFFGKAVFANVLVTYGLLKVNVGVLGCQYGTVFEPTAVVSANRFHVVGLAVQHNNHARVAPRSQEANRLFGGFHDNRFGRRGDKRTVRIYLNPNLVDLLAIDTVLIFREQFSKEGFMAFVQVGFAGVFTLGTE